jgi:hypothetical protein
VKVLAYEIAPGSWTVLIPSKPTGLYPTAWEAARAAWATRWHGTPEGGPAPANTIDAS